MSLIDLTDDDGNEIMVNAYDVAFVQNPRGPIAGGAQCMMALRSGAKLRLKTPFATTVERWREATDP